MMSEKILCPCCQQVIKLCECSFEVHEEFLRNLRNEAFRSKELDKKNADRESRTYKINR